VLTKYEVWTTTAFVKMIASFAEVIRCNALNITHIVLSKRALCTALVLWNVCTYSNR